MKESFFILKDQKLKTKNSPPVEASFCDFFFLERYTYYFADPIAHLQDSRLRADFASSCLLLPRTIAPAEFTDNLILHLKHSYFEKNPEKSKKIGKQLQFH